MALVKKTVALFTFLLLIFNGFCQETSPVNGVADIRDGSFAFTHATIVKDAQTTFTNATLIIKKGKIIFAGTG